MHTVAFGEQRQTTRESAAWAADTYEQLVNTWLREGWEEVCAEVRHSVTIGSFIEDEVFNVA